MGWIKNGLSKFLNQNFFHQRLPAKKSHGLDKSVISLECCWSSWFLFFRWFLRFFLFYIKDFVPHRYADKQIPYWVTTIIGLKFRPLKFRIYLVKFRPPPIDYSSKYLGLLCTKDFSAKWKCCWVKKVAESIRSIFLHHNFSFCTIKYKVDGVNPPRRISKLSSRNHKNSVMPPSARTGGENSLHHHLQW